MRLSIRRHISFYIRHEVCIYLYDFASVCLKPKPVRSAAHPIIPAGPAEVESAAGTGAAVGKARVSSVASRFGTPRNPTFQTVLCLLQSHSRHYHLYSSRRREKMLVAITSYSHARASPPSFLRDRCCCCRCLQVQQASQQPEVCAQ